MAELATLPENRGKLTPGTTAVTAAMVERLEHEIDATSERFEPPTEFVVPGETKVAALLDVARTVARRAERHALVAARRTVARRHLPQPPVRPPLDPGALAGGPLAAVPPVGRVPMPITFDTAVTRPRTADVVGLPVATDGPAPRGGLVAQGARRPRLHRQAGHDGVRARPDLCRDRQQRRRHARRPPHGGGGAGPRRVARRHGRHRAGRRGRRRPQGGGPGGGRGVRARLLPVPGPASGRARRRPSSGSCCWARRRRPPPGPLARRAAPPSPAPSPSVGTSPTRRPAT